MENIIAVMVNKFRGTEGKRSVEFSRKTLAIQELDEFEKKHYDSVEEMVSFRLLNNLSSAYQKGISAGIKLASKRGMNEIDAITFTIKQLQKVKDDLKTKTAEDIVES